VCLCSHTVRVGVTDGNHDDDVVWKASMSWRDFDFFPLFKAFQSVVEGSESRKLLWISVVSTSHFWAGVAARMGIAHKL
jgi:hypothetical protein